VRDADKKSVLAIARDMRDFGARAKQKKLKPEEMADGTFSISNLGMFGIDVFSAVINPPEGAILAVGRIRDEPVVRNDRVVPGKKLGLTLSCDHRAVDGAIGASFLAELRALIEQPMRILTGCGISNRSPRSRSDFALAHVLAAAPVRAARASCG